MAQGNTFPIEFVLRETIHESGTKKLQFWDTQIPTEYTAVLHSLVTFNTFILFGQGSVFLVFPTHI